MSRVLAVVLALVLGSAVRGEKAKPTDPRLLNEGPVVTIALSPDNSLLATGSVGRTLRLWDVKTGKERLQLEHPGGVSSVVFSPDGKTLVSAGGDQRLRLWDVAAGKELRQIDAGFGNALTVIFAPDGKTLACAGDAIRLFDVATGKEQGKLTGHDGTVLAVAFSPDGKTLASAGEDQEIRLWNVADGTGLRQWKQAHGVVCLAFAPDGKTLASGSGNGGVFLWSPANGKEVARFGGGIGRPACVALAFSGDGKVLAGSTTCPAPAVSRWDVASGKELETPAEFTGALLPITFAANCKGLAEDAKLLTFLNDVADPTFPRSLPVFHLSAEEFSSLWADLGAADPSRASEAVFTLAGDEKQTVPFLKANLKPEAPFPPVAQLITDLDDNRFAVRRKATEELQRMGRSAERPLRDALKGPLPLEVMKRIQRLLEHIEQGVLPPEQLRAHRAVRVLEYAGTDEARQVLLMLTQGAPEGWLTREAKAALGRMGK